MRLTKKNIVKAYVAYSLCMDSDVFIRIFGGLGDRGANIGGFQSANPVLLLFSFTLVAWTAALILPIMKRVTTVLVNVPLMAGLYLWSLASCLWAEQPSIVLRQGIPLCAYLLCGVVTAVYLTSEEVASLIGNLTSVIAALSLIWERLDPVRGTIAPGWTGVYGEKNHLGMGMGVGIIALLVLPGRWTLARMLKLLLCGVLLVGSQSATAMGFVFVTVVIYLVTQLSARAKPLGVTVVLTAAVVPLLIVPGAIGKAFALSGKSTDFTGRDVIWNFVFQEWLRRPILGFGYGSYWINEADRVQQNLGWNPGSAHNGILEILLNTGLVGVLLLLGVLAGGVVLIWRAWRRGARTAAVWLLLAWLAMFIDDLTEADYMVPAPLWFTYCLVLFLTYAAVKRKSDAHQHVVHVEPQISAQRSFAIPA